MREKLPRASKQRSDNTDARPALRVLRGRHETSEYARDELVRGGFLARGRVDLRGDALHQRAAQPGPSELHVAAQARIQLEGGAI